MDEEQIQKFAKLLVKNAIENAVEKVKNENKEMDKGLKQGVDDIVGLTIGRSITAIREGQHSPTDNKMKEWEGQFDKEVDNIVGQTIGRSISAIREGQSLPTDDKVEGMLGLNKTLGTATPEVTTGATGSKALGINDGEMKPSVVENDEMPDIITSNLTKDDKPTGQHEGHVTLTQANKSKVSYKKNFLERLLDRLLKRDKKEAVGTDAVTVGGSTVTSVGGKKKSPSKAHNKRDWIRKNLLCCFIRQTATVEPLSE